MSTKSIFQVATDKSARSLIFRLFAYAKPYLNKIYLGLFCMVGVAAATAASAKLMKPIINDIFLDQRADMLWPITGAIFLVFFFKGIFGYGESVLMAFVGNRVIADIQTSLFNKLITADLKFYQRTQSGELVSRFMNDVNKLNTAITGTLSRLGKDTLTFIFFVIIMFSEDWRLATIVFVVLPVAILPVVKIGRKMRKVSTNVQEQTADLTILLTQAFQGIRLVKSYCMEAYETSKINKVIEGVFSRTIKGVRTKSITHPLMEFLGGVAIAVVILYGGSQVIAGTHTPGAFFTFITALIMSYEPLKRLANLSAEMQEQLAAADRVFTLMGYQSKIVTAKDAPDLKVTKGTITFDGVDFSYTAADKPVLKNINLHLKQGKKAALVGPSGSGKTTLMNLIPRFFDADNGSVLIDQQDVRKVSLDSLRRSIALVSQEVVLFDDTVAKNIGFGDPDASMDKIKAAAKAAAAHEFIEDLPDGYETMVGEQGLRLSGGQRQRLSIARAFLKNAPIILMDEPTSALDSASEKKIQQALDKLMHGKTTLIIAHRLATVRDADTIYVLEDGVVSAQGSHSELLVKSDKYKQLCKIQFQD